MSGARYTTHGAVAVVAALCCVAFAFLLPAPASALVDNPAWTVSAVSAPTNFAPGDHSGEDFYKVIVTNTGDAPSNGRPVTITDTLPAGLTLAPAGVSATETLSNNSLSCVFLTCTYAGAVAAGDTLTLNVPVDVETTRVGPLAEPNVVAVSGGGAGEASASTPTTISETPSPGYGIAPGAFSTTLSSTQAGAHADMATSFYFNTDAAGSTGGGLKDTVVELPVGFAGDPAATPTCSAAQLANSLGSPFTACPLDSQVGTVTLLLGGPAFPGENRGQYTGQLFNMAPLGGEVTRLGFNIFTVSTNVVITVRPGDYGLQATSPNLESGSVVEGVKLTVWGVPADPSHNLMRGTFCFPGHCLSEIPCKPGEEGCESGWAPVSEGLADPEPAKPFLTNPTRCTSSPLTSTLRVDTWQNPAIPVESEPDAEAQAGPMTGCERLEFNPGLSVAPTSTVAETPTGLNVGVTIPQTYENPEALASSNLDDATVTLPEGITVNPSAGEGLGACTPAQYEAEVLETTPGEGCPNDSSLGTITVHTPVLAEEATGSVYLAQPYNNPFGEPGHPSGSLLAIYVVARIPKRGVLVKLAGKVTPNPVTGQLVTSFDEDPQLPFDKVTFSFRPGEAAPLVSPPACGSYSGLGQFSSWSEPSELLSELSSPFQITQGVGGGSCPTGGVPPFNPQVISGTLSNSAGSYSPFYLRILRNDGEQEITRFTTILPPGLTGNLSGIPFCPEADIEAARQATGTQENEHPSCPAASEIGYTRVGAGVGGVLAQTPGKVYLAGPYHGAPLSVVSITSATVGPFDLGTVVIRFALNINPITAQVEINGASSDPIPHIIRGIVVHVRDIRVYINREKFILNPTSCERTAIAATVTGAGADPANPADGVPVTATSPFQAADCQNLAFKPSFEVSTQGKTSKANGASLTAKLTFPNGALGTEANITKVKVDLPKQLPSRLTTLQKACTAAQFNANPAGCPAASVVGRARAITPILPVPLEGPAYFVSHGGEAFPSLIVVLQGYGFTIDLVGTTFISKAGITSSTFKTVPDQPVSSFELTLPEGKFSALAANGNLCKSKLTMPTAFVAQNGAEIHESTKIAVTRCAKAKKASKKKARKARKARKAQQARRAGSEPSDRNNDGRKA